jgi:imidazole glycerol-phosphate synthase subunit HisH
VIALVDYGSGNIQAIAHIYKRAHVPFVVASTPAELDGAERIIVPGVGAFDQVMGELNRSGMRDALDRAVLGEGRPVLGICVGMQLFARGSEEGRLPGLGWIDGMVRRFVVPPDGPPLQLPHMGWNTAQPSRPDPLFEGVDLDAGFYFLHSYHFCTDVAADTLATTDYGGSFASVVCRANVYGLQFHPEKSHQAGIAVLKNFARAALAGGAA